MPQSRLRLSFTRVTEWPQALELMKIRNECAHGMTHYTGTISENQQYRFFSNHLSERGDGKYEAYILENEEEAIGFGLLKWDEEKNCYWMTAGLSRKFRGKGLSRFLISLITEMGNREGADVFIDVWEDNVAIIGDIRVGYQVVDQKLMEGRVLNIMKYNPTRLLRMSEQHLLRTFGKPFTVPREIVEELQSTVKEANPDDIVREMEEVDAISKQSYS